MFTLKHTSLFNSVRICTVLLLVGLLIPTGPALAQTSPLVIETFNKYLPVDSAENQPPSLWLRWSFDSTTANYEYCIDKMDNDTCDVDWVNSAATNSAAVNLAENTTYYWQVRAADGSNILYADSNAWWSFTTGAETLLSRRAPVVKPALPTGNKDAVEEADIVVMAGTNLIADPSFEDYSPNSYWTEYSTNFLTPLCTAVDCGGGSARTGLVWGWFGGTDEDETASLSQSVTIPSGSAALEFYLWIGYAAVGSDAADVFTAKIDETTVFSANATQTGSYPTYTLVSVDVSAYADGASHVLKFESVTTGQIVSFNLDDVALTSVSNSPPGEFAKTSPANGATGQSTSPTLSWGASSGASSYEYCYDTTNDNACSTWVSTGTTTSASLSGLTPSTTYYWQVRANNSYGTTYANGGSTAHWSFATAAAIPPGEFTKTSPANGATGQSTSPTLSWGASSGASSYEYCYDTTNDNACSTWVSTGTTTSASLSGLTPSTTYYWQVRANNSYGTTYANGSSNAHWPFVTAAPPGAFAKSSPANGATGQSTSLILAWGASSGASSYEYCYDTTNDNACSPWVSTGTTTSAGISGLTLSTTYYWQVRANNTYGTTYANGSSTTYWLFATAAPPAPGAFAKSSPANGANDQSTSPALSWGASSGAASYEYCYDTTNDNACSAWISTGTATSANLYGLTPGAIYYWQVRASNSSGTTYADGGSTAYWLFGVTTNNILLTGTTNQGQPMSFNVNSDRTAWNTFKLRVNFSGCSASGWNEITIPGPGNITNNQFYIPSSGFSATGQLTSSTTATGTYSFNNYRITIYYPYVCYIYITQSGTWNASLPLPPTPPVAFNKTSPANGATNQPTSLTLAWSASTGATSYEYCYDTTNDNACSNWANNGTSTSKALSGLSNNTTYYWHVRAINAGGNTYANGSATAFWSFTTIPFTISGNTGAAGVVLSYTDGVPKTVTSQSNGDYSLFVSNGWSGTVTPSHPCFTFSPSSQSYSNVTSNRTQNYTPTFNPASGCADINVSIGGTQRGRFGVPAQGSTRTSFAGLDNGPVKIASTNGTTLIASERINLLNHPSVASYAEFMGIPATKLTDTYLFPWYNNVSLDSQLRFGNVGEALTTVTVTIGGVERGSYELDPNESMRVSYPGVDTGPVVIQSTDGVKLIASERINLLNHPAVSSYTELLGLSASATVGTKYMFPWYNNVGLDSQLRFANVGEALTTVTVRIGGVVRGSYELDPNESMRMSYPGVDTGPVEVESSDGVPIIASERVNLLNHPAVASYTEFLGLPGTTLTDTKYIFPWYNNVGLDSQLRIANVGAGLTTVTVRIGGMVRGSYELDPNESLRVSYPGVDAGPVEVESSGGVPIIASERINLLNHPAVASYAEMMGLSVGAPLGLPGNQLSDTYWFPWYNNVGLDSQLRFAVP